MSESTEKVQESEQEKSSEPDVLQRVRIGRKIQVDLLRDCLKRVDLEAVPTETLREIRRLLEAEE